MASPLAPLLIVEGATEERLLSQLLRSAGIDVELWRPTESQPLATATDIAICQPFSGTGKEALLKDMRPRIRAAKEPAIGYVLDANTSETTRWNPAATWQSVCDRLAAEGIVVSDPKPVGNAIRGERSTGANDKTRVGVWMMPNNRDDGAVEDFIGHIADPAEQLLRLAGKCVEKVRTKHNAQFHIKDQKKASVLTWLAWQKTPGMSYREAFARGVLKMDQPLSIEFVEWVGWLIDGSPSESDSGS